jgi:vitamin B12/bleomycin/antimicrobial peptide transport system ATP-binding/permease protein
MRRSMRRLGPVLKDAWRLSLPYFKSEEKLAANALLFSIIALNLAMVGMNVVLNFWNGAFYDSLQTRDWNSFVSLLFLYKKTPHGFLPGFCGIAAVYILVAVYSTYLNQWLQIRWRRWLTRRYLDDWLGDRVYYRMSLVARPGGEGTDNPDQRISEDIRDFVDNTLSLGLDLLSNVVTLFSFVGILWSLSGAMKIFGLNIPGYMVWVALIYAVVGTWLTHLIGRPLARLSFVQQRREADFRFALARMRENTEGIALYHGEDEEHGELEKRFGGVIENWWAIMRRTKALNALTSGYGQIATIFPIVVAAPRYFSGAIQLGTLTRIASGFGQVQGAMSWFVSSYASLASWSAIVERLGSFERAIQEAKLHGGDGAERVKAGEAVTLDDVGLFLPDGKPLMEHARLSLTPGEATVISGASGSGKSTLFRVLAGIWPYSGGRITLPAGSSMFLPQRTYLPLGTLHRAITYPADPATLPAGAAEEVLTAIGLGHLLPELEEHRNWALSLSGGEQQRLAIGRALLLKPDWLFLDEATANLDPEAEQQLYDLLRTRLPQTTVVSIAHRESVARLHERRILLKGGHLGDIGGPLTTAAE